MVGIVVGNTYGYDLIPGGGEGKSLKKKKPKTSMTTNEAGAGRLGPDLRRRRVHLHRSLSCGWRGLNSLFMLFVYKRSHTHTYTHAHTHTHTAVLPHAHNLNFTSTSLGKIFSKCPFQGESRLHNEVLFGSQPLGSKRPKYHSRVFGYDLTDQGWN